jgi:hypothetical protein
MINKDQLLESVKAEFDKWHQNCPSHIKYAYNTGYGGQGTKSDETVSQADFDEAVKEFKQYVPLKLPGYSVRSAKSSSGEVYNEWSFLCEPINQSITKKFNYHIRVVPA